MIFLGTCHFCLKISFVYRTVRYGNFDIKRNIIDKIIKTKKSHTKYCPC